MSGQQVISFSDSCEPSLEDRFLSASQICWHVENNSVIMLPAETPEDLNIRSQLQALGLEAYQGGASLNNDPFPVIVVEAGSWRLPRIRKQVRAIRQVIPNAPVCVLTGMSKSRKPTRCPAPTRFDDARAFLDAAGFSFISFGGDSIDHSA